MGKLISNMVLTGNGETLLNQKKTTLLGEGGGGIGATPTKRGFMDKLISNMVLTENAETSFNQRETKLRGEGGINWSHSHKTRGSWTSL